MAIRQPLSTGTSESSIIFYNGGHNHDGISSARIDTAKYSFYDFTANFSSEESRRLVQEENSRVFRNVISDIVKTSVLGPSGITLGPNQVRAENISAGAVTATALAANIVLVNNFIASGNYVAGVSGWAISSNGTAEFANTSIRGAIEADSLATPGISIDSAGNLTADNFALYGNGAIVTSSGNFSVDASGNLSANNAEIRGEISSDTFVTHTNFAGAGSWTRPTVLIDNANNRLEVNSTDGGLRMTADGVLRYASGSSFYNILWDFDGGTYSFLGTIYVGTIEVSSVVCDDVTSTGAIYAGTSYLSSGAIYSTNTITADGAMLAPYFIMSAAGTGAGSSLIRRSDGYILINSSKRELKTNIGDISDSLVKIAALRPRVFNWKSQLGDPDDIFHREIKTNHKTMGFVVEEVAETSPEYLEYRIAEDGTLDGHYWKPHDFIALAMQGIKDLSAKVTSLEQRIAQLEG